MLCKPQYIHSSFECRLTFKQRSASPIIIVKILQDTISLTYQNNYIICHPEPPCSSNGQAKFEIQWNCVMLLFIARSVDHNEKLHPSRHEHCRGVFKILSWSVEHSKKRALQNLIEFRFRSKYRYWDGRQGLYSLRGRSCKKFNYFCLFLGM